MKILAAGWLSRDNALAVLARIVRRTCVAVDRVIIVTWLDDMLPDMLPNILPGEIARVPVGTVSLVARVASPVLAHFRVIFSLVAGWHSSISLIPLKIPLAAVPRRLVRSYRFDSLLLLPLVPPTLDFFDLAAVELRVPLRFFRSIALFVRVNVPVNVEIHQAGSSPLKSTGMSRVYFELVCDYRTVGRS